MQRREGINLKNSGVILELNNKEAVVITSESRFVIIKRKPDMVVGQEIIFDSLSNRIFNKKTQSLFLAAASIAAIFVITFISYIYLYLPFQSSTYAYIGIDINPSIELGIDSEHNVINFKPLNEDANIILKAIDLKGMNINKALISLVQQSEIYGYLRSENDSTIYISASFCEINNDNNKTSREHDEQKNNFLLDMENGLRSSFNNTIDVEVLKISALNRKLAYENNLSMAKYNIYSSAINEGITISKEEVQNNSISSTIKKIEQIRLKSPTRTELGQSSTTSDKNDIDSKADHSTTENSGVMIVSSPTPTQSASTIESSAPKTPVVQPTHSSISTKPTASTHPYKTAPAWVKNEGNTTNSDIVKDNGKPEDKSDIEVNEKSDNAGRPDDDDRPDNAGKPDNVGRPDNAGKPDNAGRPDDAGKPDNAGRPDNAGKPDDND